MHNFTARFYFFMASLHDYKRKLALAICMQCKQKVLYQLHQSAHVYRKRAFSHVWEEVNKNMQSAKRQSKKENNTFEDKSLYRCHELYARPWIRCIVLWAELQVAFAADKASTHLAKSFWPLSPSQIKSLRCSKHGQLLPLPAHSTCTSLNPDVEHILSSLHDKHQTIKHSFLNSTQTHSQNSKQFEKFFNNQE